MIKVSISVNNMPIAAHQNMRIVNQSQPALPTCHSWLESENDKRTFSILTKIANEIDPDIVMSAEVPSDFPNRKLPFLDTQVWMEEKEGGGTTGRILWKFFEKEMNSCTVMSEKSALDPRIKRTIHTQEVLRIYRNTHEDVPKEEVDKDVTKYMKKLQNSGHDRNFYIRKECMDRDERGSS